MEQCGRDDGRAPRGSDFLGLDRAANEWRGSVECENARDLEKSRAFANCLFLPERQGLTKSIRRASYDARLRLIVPLASHIPPEMIRSLARRPRWAWFVLSAYEAILFRAFRVSRPVSPSGGILRRAPLSRVNRIVKRRGVEPAFRPLPSGYPDTLAMV